MNRNRLFWGGIVMLLGFLLLLNSVGLLHVNVWKFIGPGILILFGLWFIFNSFFQKNVSSPETLSIPSEGENELYLEFAHGAGRLNVAANSTSTTLLNGTFANGVNSQVLREGSLAKIYLKPSGDPIDFIIPGNFQGMNWDVQLNPDLPVRMVLKGGASEALLNLSQVNLKELEISTGASKTDITFSEKASYSRAKISAGVAEVCIQIPAEIAASISVHGKELSSIRVDTQRFIQQGDRYESANYAAAEKKLELEINPGLGEVKIQ